MSNFNFKEIILRVARIFLHIITIFKGKDGES